MKALLFLAGLIFVVAGIATGVVSQMDYGKALIGLNLGLAATLLVGGFVLMGLGSAIGAISRLAENLPMGAAISPQPTIRQEPVAKDDMPFPAATAAVGATAGAAGLAVGAAFDSASDGVDKAVDKVAEVAKEVKEEAAGLVENVSDAAGDMADKAKEVTENVGDKVSEVAGDAKDAVTDKAEDAVEIIAEKTDKASDVANDVVNGATPDSDAADEKDGEEDGDQLYIVEEVEIRGKQARVLSDDTVEAETAEGWMRFENLEHLEEYLDAMEA